MPQKKPSRKPNGTRGTLPIDALRHNDTRKNIPTEELRDFVRDDEQKPKTVLYPRDPSLDPQLVWKGKDEQDAQPLAVPSVPIYIQEKIHPQAIIEDFRRGTAFQAVNHGQDGHATQLNLFADFNGLEGDFDRKVDFYQHDQHWSNRMILGDSLLVMTSLAEKEGLKGKVQCIYFDPPYGIKFGSNWQVSTRKRDVKDGKAEDMTRQPEQIKAFRDTYVLGIHSYLPYLRDRLCAARELLADTGSIFVQISDDNVHLVRSVLDEVFGSENHVVTITFRKKGGQKSGFIDPVNDFLLWYSKMPRDGAERGPKFRPAFISRAMNVETLSVFDLVELADGSTHSLASVPVRGETRDYRIRPQQLASDLPGARLFTSENLTSGGVRTNQSLPFMWAKVTHTPKAGNSWKHTARRTTPDVACGMERLGTAARLMSAENTWRYKRFFDDFPYNAVDNWWDNIGGAADPIYVVQTNPEIAKRCILMTTDPGDLVLDPTCGSGTTAYVAEQWGRRWITIDTSRVALALARTRLMCARYPYYHLAADFAALTPASTDEEIKFHLRKSAQSADHSSSDIRKGFVYSRVPHITSSTIANNPDIKEGMTREQIDAAIARHAETEILYDKPYEDRSRLRVTGPFTVESLSPHRTISVDEKKDLAEHGRDGWKTRIVGPGDFARTILDNLKKAGVQNTIKAERLRFDSLEPFPGEWIHGEGRYTEANGKGDKTRRAAICIGPEFGTVGPELVKAAAKEAVRGVGFDLLIVCGFAFDPHVSEEAKRYGKLTILPARMNPDLAMGDELLKKTGAGNLFMVFGEPDIEIRRVSADGQPSVKPKNGKKPRNGKLSNGDEKIVVEIKGLDVYDPTTSEIRSNTTDDIACWFIDTNYDGESFFVRHAYFTGADEPYEKLKRALRAEIDEAAWSALYSTVSRPFDAPSTGKIAVKVINHYGDEVLKVFPV